LADRDAMMEIVNGSPEAVVEISEPFIDLAASLSPLYARLRETRQARESRLSKLSADLLKVRRDFLKSDFIPDANNTLRFTSGYVRGYSPADGTYCSPISTLTGVMEKATGR
ncbi:S46 family peptidase, partial [bacterium]